MDSRAKLERSRQSARECRARKKLRYQYLEELVSSREKAIFTLRKELEQVGSTFNLTISYFETEQVDIKLMPSKNRTVI